MCVPGVEAALATGLSSIGGAGSALSAVSAAVGVIGGLQQASTAKAMAAQNAALQQQAAEQSLEAGREESDRRRRAGAAAQAEQRAAMAANGLDVTQGDALGLLDETAELTSDDAFSIRETSRRQAQGQQQGAANSIAQGNVEASNAGYGAIKTVLTTGAKIGSRYSSWAADKYGKTAGDFA